MALQIIDLLLITAFFIILLVIGLKTAQRQTKEDFLIAERKLGVWATLCTVNASKSGSIVMLFVAMVFIWGFSAIWYFIGVISGVLLFIPFAKRLKKESTQKYYTLAHYFQYNYGKTPATIASLITIFILVGITMLNLIAGTKIFVYFTQWPFWICASLMSLVVLIYLLLGGFKAVVKTDVVQYVAMILIIIALALFMFKGAPQQEWSFFSVDVVSIAGFFIVGLLIPFSQPDLWQRVYASKNYKTLKKGLLGSCIIYFVFALMLALVALAVKVAQPSIDPDLALLAGIQTLLPSGMVGLAVILLFAAIMSTLDTYIFTAASAVVQDFTSKTKEKTIWLIKLWMIILTVIATILAIVVKDLIIGAFIFVAPVIVLSVAVITTWINKKTSPTVLQWIFGVGLAGLGIFLVHQIINGQIQPIIIIIALAFSLVGLTIGSLVTYIKRRT